MKRAPAARVVWGPIFGPPAPVRPAPPVNSRATPARRRARPAPPTPVNPRAHRAPPSFDADAALIDRWVKRAYRDARTYDDCGPLDVVWDQLRERFGERPPARIAKLIAAANKRHGFR